MTIYRIKNKSSFFQIVFISLSFIALTPSVNAGDSFKENLQTISDFADRICDEVDLNGERKELSISAKVEISTMLKKLVGLGAGIEGGGQKEQWRGISQKDLPSMVRNRTDCKLQVLEYFKTTLESSQSGGKMGSYSDTSYDTTLSQSTKDPILQGKFLASAIFSGENKIRVSADFDADGFEEEVYVKRDHPAGTDIIYLDDRVGIPLDTHFPSNAGFDEFFELEKDWYLQVAAKDVTNDGVPDILIATGNGLAFSHLVVIQFHKMIHDPNSRVPYYPQLKTVFVIDGQEYFRIQEGGYIEVPFGTQGLFGLYKWAGQTFADISHTLIGR